MKKVLLVLVTIFSFAAFSVNAQETKDIRPKYYVGSYELLSNIANTGCIATPIVEAPDFQVWLLTRPKSLPQQLASRFVFPDSLIGEYDFIDVTPDSGQSVNPLMIFTTSLKYKKVIDDLSADNHGHPEINSSKKVVAVYPTMLLEHFDDIYSPAIMDVYTYILESRVSANVQK
jgi:hypothetical protein